MNLPHWTVVGFTGHRKVDDEAAVARSLGVALDRLAQDRGPLAVVASAASGGDTLFLEAARQRGLPMLLILPFPRDEFRDDFDDVDWERVRPLIESAQRVDELPQAESREAAYMEAGTRTVDIADVMIAVLDSQRAAGGAGGTADAVDYARAVGRPVIIVHPLTGHTSEEIVEHTPSRRQHQEVAIPTDWRKAVNDEYEALDAQARREGPRARYLILYVILLHLIAAAVAVTSLSLHWEANYPHAAEAASVIKLVALVAALVLALRHRQAHHGWLHSRVGAELCRSFAAVWHFRRAVEPFPHARTQGVEDLWRALTIGWYVDRASAEPDLAAARDRYLKHRLAEQVNYYADGARSAACWYDLLKHSANVATILAIACAGMALLIEDEHVHEWSKMLSIILPLLNAALLSIVVSRDLGRRRTRYADMVRRLHDAERRLRNVRTWQSLARITSATETMLLDEVSEWQTIVRYGGEH
jgi:hypothetical protein